MGRVQVGLLAQEVREVLPEAVMKTVSGCHGNIVLQLNLMCCKIVSSLQRPEQSTLIVNHSPQNAEACLDNGGCVKNLLMVDKDQVLMETIGAVQELKTLTVSACTHQSIVGRMLFSGKQTLSSV